MRDPNAKIDTFNFWVPAEIVKADPAAKGDSKRRIRGIASTESKDLEGETIDLSGISLDYFTTKGVFNDDHKQEVSAIVGEPTSAKITKDGLFVEGILYKGKDSADKIWEHFNSLEQSGAKRRLGFSIEGKVLARKGSTITRCWLKNIAITAHPVNSATWAEIAKSFKGAEWGAPPDDEETDKAMTTASAGALVPESLEGSNKVTCYKSLDDVPAGVKLSYQDTVMTVQLSKGWSKATAEAVVDAIWLQHGLIK